MDGAREFGRREFLGCLAVSAVALSGCVDPEAVMTFDEADDDRVLRVSTRTVPDEQRDVFAEATENGSAVVEAAREDVSGDRAVEFEGRYYSVDSEVVGESTRTYYEVVLTLSDDDVDDAVAYDDLPEADRDKLEALVDRPTPDDDAERPPTVGVRYWEEETEDSALAPESEYPAVSHEESTWTVDVEGPNELSEDDLRYSVQEIAASDAEMAESIRDEHVFELSGLSDDERDLVREAIDEGYYGSSNDEFESVALKIREHDAVRSDEWGGDWIVEYEGDVYLVNLHHPPSMTEQDEGSSDQGQEKES
ncbi:MAG: hypothetical protein ACLFMT_06660 [Halobacteriales archaeon]